MQPVWNLFHWNNPWFFCVLGDDYHMAWWLQLVPNILLSIATTLARVLTVFAHSQSQALC
jgi:hypothetical protein